MVMYMRRKCFPQEDRTWRNRPCRLSRHGLSRRHSAAESRFQWMRNSSFTFPRDEECAALSDGYIEGTERRADGERALRKLLTGAGLASKNQDEDSEGWR